MELFHGTFLEKSITPNVQVTELYISKAGFWVYCYDGAVLYVDIKLYLAVIMKLLSQNLTTTA